MRPCSKLNPSIQPRPFAIAARELKLKSTFATLVRRGLCFASVLAVAGITTGCGMTDINSAEVTSVKAVTRTVNTPREECRDEVVTLTRETTDPNQVTGTVAGAVVGGVLGNQVGDGTGKDLATVAGAIAGGYAGNKTQEGMQARNTYQETQRICVMVNDAHEEQAGYDVEYMLDGASHEIHLAYDPGNSIPVVDGKLSLKE
jgi:uncharacterized protein YcfJ